MGLFKSIASIFKKKKKKSTPLQALAAPVIGGTGAISSILNGGITVPSSISTILANSSPPKKSLWDHVNGFIDGLNGTINNINTMEPFRLDKAITLPTVTIESSKKTNTNLFLIAGGIILAIVLMNKRRSQ